MTTKLNPNDTQVGGKHYKNKSIQHWDLVENYDVPYLEGCATKYLSRAHKKNGVEDLQKALHYTQKLISKIDENSRTFQSGPIPEEVMQTFLTEQGVGPEESICIKTLLGPWNRIDLELVAITIESILD